MKEIVGSKIGSTYFPTKLLGYVVVGIGAVGLLSRFMVLYLRTVTNMFDGLISCAHRYTETITLIRHQIFTIRQTLKSRNPLFVCLAQVS